MKKIIIVLLLYASGLLSAMNHFITFPAEDTFKKKLNEKIPTHVEKLLKLSAAFANQKMTPCKAIITLDDCIQQYLNGLTTPENKEKAYKFLSTKRKAYLLALFNTVNPSIERSDISHILCYCNFCTKTDASNLDTYIAHLFNKKADLTKKKPQRTFITYIAADNDLRINDYPKK